MKFSIQLSIVKKESEMKLAESELCKTLNSSKSNEVKSKIDLKFVNVSENQNTTASSSNTSTTSAQVSFFGLV